MMNSIQINDHRTQTKFSDCTLDSETQTLTTPSGIVRLRSKLWLVLNELVQNSNRLVLRESLVRDIWRGNNYTGEQGLTHAVCHLRRILKKHGVDAQIITLPKKGYILQREENMQDTLLKASSNLNPYPKNNINFSQTDFKISYTIG